MKLVRHILLGSLLVISLSACSTFKQHSSGFLKKNDRAYLKARSSPNLQIPPDLSSNKVGDEFLIPPITTLGPVPASTVPPGGISKQTPPGYVSPSAAQRNRTNFLKPIIK